RRCSSSGRGSLRNSPRGRTGKRSVRRRRNSARGRNSIRFRARQLDHLRPLLGFVREQLGEIGGRAGQRRAAPLGNPRLHLGVGEGGGGVLIEALDNNGGRAGGGGAGPPPRPPPHPRANPPATRAPP